MAVHPAQAQPHRWRNHTRIRFALTLCALLGAMAAARAETPAAPGGAAGSTAMPDPYKMNMLIRTTLIALNQANQTGNYSVLRDLGTPQFQAMNTDASLAMNFSTLRQRNLDLSPVVFFDPKLIRPAAVQPNGVLRLTGFIDSKPERILFDLGFEATQGQWRLAAVIVDMKPAPPDQPAAADASGTKAAPAKKAAPKSTNAPAATAPANRAATPAAKKNP
jgi:hypothetical protein